MLIRAGATNQSLEEIQLSGPENYRRVYFVRENAGNENFAITSTDGENWRIGMSISLGGSYPELSFPNKAFQQGIRGGVRTQAGVAPGIILTPPLSLLSETNPGSLDFIADQMMWLEDYRAP